jgi:hypothetical protein
MNWLVGKRVALQLEGMTRWFKPCIRLKEELRDLPEPVFEAGERVGTGDANPLYDLLVKVVEQMLSGLGTLFANLGFKLLLELVELK